MLFSNINGVALSDERFWPIYEAANDIGAVMYIHPEHPVNVDMMQEFWLMPLVGFLYDTTLAAASLTFNGVPERFPKIKWALCHLGGTIPYLVERLDRGFHNFKDCRAKISVRRALPEGVLLRHGQLQPGRAEAAIDFAGADHILAGSDYPHQIGSIPLMLEAVDALPVTDEQREGIHWKNAAKLLGLEQRVGR
jgi:Predicted metal-dependent hydrolase of the TIM-barrel fold